MPPYITYDGHGTRVKIDDEALFTTAFSISENQNILQSSCGYGGTLQGEDIGLAGPNVIGFGDVTGSVTFDITKTQASTLKSWLSDRNGSRIIDAETGSDGAKVLYAECYFQSISMSVSENSAVSADVDFWIYKNALDDGSIGGEVSKYGLHGNVAFSEEEKEIIPYWATKIVNFPLDVISWDINITQDVVKKFHCEGLSADKAPLPKSVFVGPLNVDLGITVLLGNEVVDLSTLSGDLSLTLRLYDVDFITMEKVKLISISPDLTATGMRTASLQYRVFKLINPV